MLDHNKTIKQLVIEAAAEAGAVDPTWVYESIKDRISLTVAFPTNHNDRCLDLRNAMEALKDGELRPRHVCGLQGYNPMLGDPPCPGCVANRL